MTQLKIKENSKEKFVLYIFILYYVLSWMSTMFPVLGISLPLKVSNIIFIISLIYACWFFQNFGIKTLSNSWTAKFVLILLIFVSLSVLRGLTYLNTYSSLIEGGQLTTPMTKWIRYFGTTYFPGLLLLMLGINMEILQDTIQEHKRPVYMIFGLYVVSILGLSILHHSGTLGTIFEGGTQNVFYLPFSDAFIVVAVVFLFIMRNSKFLFLYYLLTLYCIFKIGSRTTLLCMLLLVIADVVIRLFAESGGITLRGLILLTTIVGTIGVLTLTGFSGVNMQVHNPETKLEQSYNRMVEVFDVGGYQDDASVQGRDLIDQQNMADIKQYWFGGRFLREMVTGGYSHNVRSWWIEYGILPYILLLFLIILTILRIFKVVGTRVYAQKRLPIHLFIAYLPALLFSRAYVYPTTWLMIGLSIAMCNSSARLSSDK